METSYKEKYEQALAKAKEQYNYTCMRSGMGILEEIFPELAESEDEKMIKFIMNQLFNIKKTITDNYKLDTELTKAIDWLEKQDKNNMGISEATKQELEDNLNKALEKETPESCNEFLEKQDEQYYSCESDIDFKIEADKWYVCIKDYYYSGIDELMFTKGKAYKAYIDWGFISNNGTKKTPIGLFPYKEYFRPATDEEIPHKQKPAELNDDDKQYLLVCKNALYKYQVSDKCDANIIYQWLEDKVKSSVQQPSEEDEKILSDIIKDLVHPWNEYIPDRIEDEIKWLKNRLRTLKDRVQLKQEWSEEEIEPIISDYLCGREHYGGMIGRLCHLKPKQKQTEWNEDDKAFLDDILCKLEHDLILNKDEKDWLKSLKERIGGKV